MKTLKAIVFSALLVGSFSACTADSIEEDEQLQVDQTELLANDDQSDGQNLGNDDN